MAATTKKDLATKLAKAKEVVFNNGKLQYPLAIFGDVMISAGFQPTKAKLKVMNERFKGLGNFGFEFIQNEVTQWFTNVLTQEIEAGVSRNEDGRIDLNKRSLDYLMFTLNLKPEPAMNCADWARTRKLSECAFFERVKYKKRGSSTSSSKVELVKACSSKVHSWLRSLETTTTGEPVNKRALELETTGEPLNKKSKSRVFFVRCRFLGYDYEWLFVRSWHNPQTTYIQSVGLVALFV